MRKELQRDSPGTQETLVRVFLPKLKKVGAIYRKIKPIQARKAQAGEVITSVTQSGEETTNRAGGNDVVARNSTDAKELYIITIDKFRQRYEGADEPGEDWKDYLPLGKVKALEVNQEVMSLLNIGSVFLIEAPWEADQYCEEGDYLVSPLPDLEEVYRIGRAEFDQTYQQEE